MENYIYIKHLSGDITCMPTEEKLSDKDILERLNTLSPIHFPKYRTYLISSPNEDIYDVFINPYLYLSLTIIHEYVRGQEIVRGFRTHMNCINDTKLIKDVNEMIDEFAEEYHIDTIGYEVSEHRGKSVLEMKFLMPVESFYRLYIVSMTYNSKHIILHYKLLHYEDYNEINNLNSDLEKFREKYIEHLPNEDNKYVFILDCSGNVIDIMNL